jgi:hypothetical protein
MILFVLIDKVHNEKLKKFHMNASVKRKLFENIDVDNVSSEGI